jgi:formamidopyrimidine-DNA glycosylase
MPELPDVCGFERYLRDTSLDRRIAHTRLTEERLLLDASRQRLQSRLKGSRLRDTRRHGKWLMVRLQGAGGDRGWLCLHFGMTGELTAFEAERPGIGDLPEHTRLLLSFEDGHHLAYQSQRMLGHLSHTEDPDAFVQGRGLGPDALDGGLTADRLAERRAKVKAALMDQSVVAGIGNIYADEILFQAGIHPAARIPDLDEGRLREIQRVGRRVLRVACRHGGDIRELPHAYLLPHREDGAPCPRCGGRITTTRISGRSTYLCEAHQQRRRGKGAT